MSAATRCRTCGGRPVYPADLDDFELTAAATRRLAAALLADVIPADPTPVVERRRAQLAAAAAGRPEPEVGGGPGRARLVGGIWRWDGAA